MDRTKEGWRGPGKCDEGHGGVGRGGEDQRSVMKVMEVWGRPGRGGEGQREIERARE